MIERLRAALAAQGVELATHELLDVMWLAARLPSGSGPDGAASAAGDGGPDAAAPARPALSDALARGDGLGTQRRQEEERAAEVYGVPGPGRRSNARASSTWVGGADALSHRRTLLRALRPLRRRVPSRVECVMDEAATVAHIADTGLWDVVSRPAPARWADLVLVVDDGASMRLWQDLAEELRTVLLRSAAFRRVHVVAFDSDNGAETTLRPVPFQPAGRRLPAGLPHASDLPALALVLTDCVGAAWHTGLAQRLLARWGAKASVAIVQPLPRLLWPRTGANPRQMLLRSRTAGTPNIHVHASEPMLPLPALRAGQIPVPVLELTGEPLTDWAAFVANGGSATLPVLAVSGADADPAPTPATPATPASPADGEPRPRDSVSTFRSAVSPQAYRLAGHLAAVEPLTLPVMRVVQRAVLPDSHPGYLAEVFLGGVLERVDAKDPRWDRYRLRPGIGKLLLDTLSTRDGMRTIDAVSSHFERSATSGAKLPILLRNPEGSATLPENLAPLARVGSPLLRHLGLLPAEPADAEPTETPALPTPPELEEETEELLRAQIDYLRERAEEDEQSLRALARNTYRLGILLKEEERKEEARDALEAATHMFRRLTTDSRSDIADLARSLYQAGVMLWRLGQYESALDRDREAVSLWRPLAAEDPDTYEADLADSLYGIGVDLSEFGRHEEALLAYREAVEIFRRLAAGDPEKYEADLAKPADNAGWSLSKLGRHEEALVASCEAVEIRRRLAAGDPGKFEDDFAESVFGVGVYLSKLGRHEEALVAYREAVEIRRRLAAGDPGKFEDDLAESVFGVGFSLSNLGRHEEALVAYREEVEIRRRLAAGDPGKYEAGLALSVGRLGVELHELRRFEEGLAAFGEEAEIWGRLVAVDPERRGDLARSLYNVGVSLQSLGRWNESLDTMSRAVAAYEQTVRTGQRSQTLVALAGALGGQTRAFVALGRREEALAVVDRAIGIVDDLDDLDDLTDEDSHVLDALRNLKAEIESPG